MKEYGEPWEMFERRTEGGRKYYEILSLMKNFNCPYPKEDAYTNEPDFEPRTESTTNINEPMGWVIIASKYGISKKNAERIIACVNACEGMKNPEKEISKLKNQI